MLTECKIVLFQNNTKDRIFHFNIFVATKFLHLNDKRYIYILSHLIKPIKLYLEPEPQHVTTDYKSENYVSNICYDVNS